MSRILPTIFSGFGAAFFILLLFRIDYSRPIILMGALFNSVGLLVFYAWQEKHRTATLHLVGKFYSKFGVVEDKLNLKPFTPKQELRTLHDGILVDMRTPFTAEEEQVIADCSVAQIPVYDINRLQERCEFKVPSLHLSDNTLRALQPNSSYFRIKFAQDFFIALICLIMTSPIMATLYFLLRIKHGNPVIFKQIRIGQHGKPFTLYKFRTMHSRSTDESPQFASFETERITKLGSILRKSRLDELPQLWNVLKGDMSIIGPRPEQPIFAEQFAQEIPFYNYRHIVKPGITGWAQVTQGYADCADSTKEKLAYDFYYLKHLGWQIDFEIYLKTIRVMITGKGAT